MQIQLQNSFRSWGLTAALLIGLLWTPILLASQFCDNLKADYEIHYDTYEGRSFRLIDFNQFMASQKLFTNIRNQQFLSMKHIFEDFKKEILINFNYDGHVSVTVGGYRFDGRLAYIRPITFVESRSTIESGMLVRLRPSSTEMVSELLTAMQDAAGSRSITCVSGTCSMIQNAGLSFPSYYKPGELMRHILKEGFEWRGEKIDFDIITTNEIGKLQSYLRQLDRAPQTLAWQGLRSTAATTRQLAMGALAFIQKRAVEPITGLFFFPINSPPKDSQAPQN